MRIQVNGREFPSDKVTYREMGFGQSVFGKSTADYKVIVPAKRLKDRVEAIFDRFVEENKLDDQITDWKDAIPELVANDYSPFQRFLEKNPADLCAILREYLFFEVLEALLGKGDPGQAKFAINDIETFEYSEGEFVIRGECFQIVA